MASYWDSLPCTLPVEAGGTYRTLDGYPIARFSRAPDATSAVDISTSAISAFRELANHQRPCKKTCERPYARGAGRAPGRKAVLSHLSTAEHVHDAVFTGNGYVKGHEETPSLACLPLRKASRDFTNRIIQRAGILAVKM